MRKQPKRPTQIKELGDLDLLTIFLHGKKKPAQSSNLRLVVSMNGGLNLLIQHERKWKLYATRATIQDGIGRKRFILVLDPAIASTAILRATFSGFDETAIHWIKGLVPLTFDKAKSIYSQANSPLLQMGNE